MIPRPASELLARLEVQLDDPESFVTALLHRSWCAENGGVASNERLEFLGDAVLGLVVTNYLFRAYPTLPEGELAKTRAAVVSTISLADVAQTIEIGEFLFLGRGEDQSGGRQKRSILADAVESVIGAVYMDQGWHAAEKLVMKLLHDRIEAAAQGPGGHDYKTRLQELTVQRFERIPKYTCEDSGPDHDKRFAVTVLVADEVYGTGTGRSKKQAEQAAAREALGRLAAD